MQRSFSVACADSSRLGHGDGVDEESNAALGNDVRAYIHTLVTGGFNPHRRQHLESAGLWLYLQTCNLLYSIFPVNQLPHAKNFINSRI